MNQTRNYIFDAIKALAIWLVLLGHCVQYLSGADYHTDALYQFIYSFHMPLFFMVSGFFFASSLKLNWWQFLQKKAIALLLPCFVWGIFMACATFSTWGTLVENIFLPIHWPFWFLKVLFVVQLFAYISLKLAGCIKIGELKTLVLAIICSIALCFLPYASTARMMILAFWVGYIIKLFYEQFVRHHKLIAIIAAVAFSGIYAFWAIQTLHQPSDTISLHQLASSEHIPVMPLVLLACKRLLGIAGSIAIIAAMHDLKKEYKPVAIIGASTAGIYILQTFILEKGLAFVFDKYIDLHFLPIYLNYLLMIGISFILLVFITWLYRQLSKSNIINLTLFGTIKK